MGLEVSTIHRGTGKGLGAPWWVVPSSWLFWPSHKALGSLLFQKNHQKVSTHLENFHFCTKNNTTVILLKTSSVRVSSMQIIPKPYKIIVNMAKVFGKVDTTETYQLPQA